jgi:hypothetical protein
MNNELETALIKNIEAPKQKPTTCEEMEKNVLGMRKSFGHVSLDYISQLNRFYFTRSSNILDMVNKHQSLGHLYYIVNFLFLIKIQLYSQSIKSYYQFGSILVENQAKEIADMTSNLDLMSQSSKKQIEEMEYRYDFIRSNVSFQNRFIFSKN